MPFFASLAALPDGVGRDIHFCHRYVVEVRFCFEMVSDGRLYLLGGGVQTVTSQGAASRFRLR